MNKPLLFLVLGCFAFAGLPAQQIMRCGTNEYNALLEKNDPSFSLRRQAIYNRALEFVPPAGPEAGSILDIPVVFHVVWNTAAQNISNARLLAQIDQLNLDYAASNPDTASIPPVFKSALGNVDIGFCLATQDPNGQPTDGIVRVQTSITVFSQSNPPYLVSPAWNSSRYLNIWVCNLGSGLLGYAQFPGGGSASDGIVQHYGTVGSAQTPSGYNWGGGTNYNWGRTGTHEIGHWLGLFHTFEGGCHTNCTAQGDKICDTPPVSGPSYGCPSFPKISCSNGPNGGMFMNYMDYVDDDCMYLFTNQQANVMLGILNSARVLLQTSLGCVPVGIQENNPLVAVSAYPNPATTHLTIEHKGIYGGTVTLYDSFGRQVAITGLKSEKSFVSTDGLASGIYVARITTNGRLHTTRVVVRRD